jgi:hypothetical protein
VEALALAQLIESQQEPDLGGVAVKELTFEIGDVDRILQRVNSDRQTPRMLHPAAIWEIEEGEAPPQAGFYVLDRPDPRDWQRLKWDDFPRLFASVALFGRETDQGPRARARLTQDVEYESKLAIVRELLEVGDSQPTDEALVMSLSPVGNAVMYYSYAPPNIPIEVRMRLYEECRTSGVFDVWPSSPQSVLGGKTPSELSADPARKLDLEAAMLRLFETQVSSRVRPKIEAIWQRLGVTPLPLLIDPHEIPAARLTFVRLRRVDATKLSDEQLSKLTLQAAILNATQAIAYLGPEILSRPQLHRTVNLYAVCRASSVEAPNYEAAAAFISDARRLVSKDVIPAGIWDVIGLEVALDHFEERRLPELFSQAAASADADDRVARLFVRALAERGLIAPDGTLRIPALMSRKHAEPREERRIWTPDSASAPQEPAKIWTP